ncbi:stressosome-associated protein Prli42 [Virgibacillus dakarensis]|nr:stressosome-associated protein Prli42 [Virgibacillus dakarensis]MTW85070.1 stressosome-associated protein Prli42 [Virgibacillus dakarensis]
MCKQSSVLENFQPSYPRLFSDQVESCLQTLFATSNQISFSDYHIHYFLHLSNPDFNDKIQVACWNEGGIPVAQKQINKQAKQAARKRSKREKRFKAVVYIMILAMVLTLFTTGLAMFL